MPISDFAREAAVDLQISFPRQRFGTILADPPWQFQNRTGKIAPEHHRLSRYETMTLDDIRALPVGSVAAETAHLYLWTPNALLPEALQVMEAWGFCYKSNIIWHKIRKDEVPGRMFSERNSSSEISIGRKRSKRHPSMVPPSPREATCNKVSGSA